MRCALGNRAYTGLTRALACPRPAPDSPARVACALDRASVADTRCLERGLVPAPALEADLVVNSVRNSAANCVGLED